ncbi:MAG: protein-ADP-ribose hydrolase [Clostridia bacterium]|nr:protein-ADP-ribose hydrolase [Clostridia bacterium]
MTQSERRIFLIGYLLDENPNYRKIEIPPDEEEQKKLFRALVNVRDAKPIGETFLKIQDEYLKTEIKEKGVTDYRTAERFENGIYLWQGDITTLKCDAVVNAANSALLGCFHPNHGCIDNQIHFYSGVQLRLECESIMRKRLSPEPTGSATLTKAYNLPCKYVIHTVGPIIRGKVSKEDETLLSSCYTSCLGLAEKNGIESVAFCCISTGEFCFPNELAAKTAVEAVNNFKKKSGSKIEVIFNVFKDYDRRIYEKLLQKNRTA